MNFSSQSIQLNNFGRERERNNNVNLFNRITKTKDTDYKDCLPKFVSEKSTEWIDCKDMILKQKDIAVCYGSSFEQVFC